MSHRNKERSYEHEIEVVEFWEDQGFEAERAYASVGESLTDSQGEQLTEDVDNIVYGALPPAGDLLIQAKRRKSVGSYVIPGGIRDGVYLETEEGKTNLYVFPDHVFAALVTGQPKLAMHIDVEDRTSSSPANYLFPPPGAHVSAIREDNSTVSYYTVTQPLYHRLINHMQVPQASGGGSNVDAQQLAAGLAQAGQMLVNASESLQNNTNTQE